MLGASRFAAWRKVTLPALSPAVAAAALMVPVHLHLVRCGADPRRADLLLTLEVEI